MFKIIFNPFTRISPIVSLIVGLIAIFISSVLAGMNGIHFYGMFSVQLGEVNGTLRPLLESIINLLFLSLLGWILIFLIAKKKANFLSFVGQISLTRVPFLFAVILGFNQGIDRASPYSFNNIIIGMTMLVFSIWSLVLLYQVIKLQLSGEVDKKWIVFFLLIIIPGLVTTKIHQLMELLLF